MARSYNFSIVRLVAHPARDERLNIGLVVFGERGLDVRVARSLDKIRAISGAIDAQAVRDAVIRLAETDSYMLQDGNFDPKARFNALQSLSAVDLSPLGSFTSHSSASYDNAISNLLVRLVEPEPAPARKSVRRSRLLKEMKTAFRIERVLAKKGEDLSAHRLIAGLELAQGLSADLVLKNGAMHVIETVDAGTDDISIRKVVSDIAVSALVLEQARMTFGEDQTHSRLVYDASASMEAAAKPSLLAAQHQGAELINWASHEDREKLIALITSLATPFEVRTKRKDSTWINASRQTKLMLN